MAEVSLEDRRLLNPAFAGMLVLRAALGYKKEAKSGMPFVYSYLVLPLVLHPETRECLPNAIVTRLIAWTERNADLIALLPRRVGELAPASREGLLIMSLAGQAALGPQGKIDPTCSEKKLIKFESSSQSEEVMQSCRKANFVGRWLATSGTVPTVLTALGIQL